LQNDHTPSREAAHVAQNVCLASLKYSHIVHTHTHTHARLRARFTAAAASKHWPPPQPFFANTNFYAHSVPPFDAFLLAMQ